MTLAFAKYQGLGNDFILVDNRHQATLLVTPEQAIRLCDRHFGIGADGVIFVLPAVGETDYTMRIFNADGSEPEMCGNGIRCFAKFVGSLEGKTSTTYRVHTLAGVIRPTLEVNGQVTVDMGEPQLRPDRIPTTLGSGKDQAIAETLNAAGQDWGATCVSMGNPHCIIFVPQVAAVPLGEWGPQFENHPAFPQRTNTEFVEVVGRDYLKMRVWERGSGITLACGTGACATVVAAVLNGHSDRRVTVELPGGPLQVHWSENDNRVYMTGPAERVFTGEVTL